MAGLVCEQYRMEPLNSIITGEPQSVNTNDEAARLVIPQTKLGGFSKASPSSKHPSNVVDNLTQADRRSEICVSPSWQTDRERRERKKELKRITKETKELERSSKSESKKTDHGPFNEPRRLSKKQPVKTPSRASSIKSVLPRSSTTPSSLKFWSNSTSRANYVREKPDSNTSASETGGDIVPDDLLEPRKPIFTGHLPQRFGGRIIRDAAYDRTSYRAFDSDSSPSVPLSLSDSPRRHLHAAKKHSDLRAAARASRSNDSTAQNADIAPPRSSWSQELTRRLSNSNGKKLQRRSLKVEHEPHMYSLRRGSTGSRSKGFENGTESDRKTEKSVPATPTRGDFHPTTGIPSPSLQNGSQITVVHPDENIISPQNTASQQDPEANTTQTAVRDRNHSSEQEQLSTVSSLSLSSPPKKMTHKPAENRRKNGRRNSWSEILNNSDRIPGVYLKHRGQGRDPLQKAANGDVQEFKTSGPYESNYASDGVLKSDAAKSDPSMTPGNWHVAAENIGVAGDSPQVQAQTESPDSTTPTDLPLDPMDGQETAVVIDPLNVELVMAAPDVKQRENPMRMAPKIINRDVPFKSSPLAAPPLNNQDDESTVEQPGKTLKQGDNDVSFKSKDEKFGFSSGFSFSRILRHGSKKEKNSIDSGFTKTSMLVNPTRRDKEPKAPNPGSNVLQKKQNVDDKPLSKLPNSAEVRLEVSSQHSSTFARQYNLVHQANDDKSNDIKIPPKSPKRNSGLFPTPASTRPSSASGVEIMSTSSNETEKPGKKKRSISVDISKRHTPHDFGKERYNNKPTSSNPSPTLLATQSIPISSSFPSVKQLTTNPLTPSDFHTKTPEIHHQNPSGPIYDCCPSSSSRHSLASSLGNGRAAAQRPARRGTPVAKMFVICCQCRYWHDMPSDIYAKLAFPNGLPSIEPILCDDSHSPLHQPQFPTASSGSASHGGGSSSTVTDTSSGASNHVLDNKSSRGSRPSSSSSSSSNNFMVTCCWCAHRMVKTCCAGWTTIVYLHERHH